MLFGRVFVNVRIVSAAFFLMFVLAASGFAQTAYVPVRVIASSGQTATVTFAPPSVGGLSGVTKEITVGADTTFVFNLGSASISHRAQGSGAGAAVSFKRGSVSLKLPSQQYQNAAVSLYAINGKRALNWKVASASSATASSAAASSAAGSLNKSLASVPAGVYLLSVNGVNGNTFSSRLSHSGGKLNINAAFTGDALSSGPGKLAKSAAANNEWTVSATSTSYAGRSPSPTKIIITQGANPTIYIKFCGTSEYMCGSSAVEVTPSRLPDVDVAASKPLPTPAANYTESVGSQSFEMIYIPGGTFTLGCTGSGCPPDTRAVEGVTVSPYYIAKAVVTSALWSAVMGSGSPTSSTWYDAMVFACRLSKMTGRNYRMQTEAEFEYAVKRPSKSGLTLSATTEEWAYNSWSGTHSGGTDPVGPGSGQHTQKTRRNASGYPDTVGRLIRSIEGIGPALRLVISANGNFPPEYVAPCNIHAPEMDREPVNSYRDTRWVTGSDSAWAAVTMGQQSAGSFNIRVWEDGTAQMTGSGGMGGNTTTNGQWFTSNNIALVFVPSSGAARKYPYVMVDATHASLLSEQSFMNGGFIGRIEKRAASSVAKPAITNLQSGRDLAMAQPNFETDYKMVDMVNIPASAKKQDPRLIDGPGYGWFQNNSSAGGLHHYRKDVDADEFRFTVNQGNRIILANGAWFTVNNTFLRVTHSTGYTVEYVYTASDNTFYHNSFMGYERGDFRMFEKVNNSAYSFPGSCGSGCSMSDEIPKGLAASMYGGNTFPMRVGQSTFVPAPCPVGGCQ